MAKRKKNQHSPYAQVRAYLYLLTLIFDAMNGMESDERAFTQTIIDSWRRKVRTLQETTLMTPDILIQQFRSDIRRAELRMKKMEVDSPDYIREMKRIRAVERYIGELEREL